MVIIKIKSKGQEVVKLTKLLKEHGLWLGKSTDKFDSAVRQAVKVFQSSTFDSRGRPLEPDGIVGPLTWWALEATDATEVFEVMKPEDFYDIPADAPPGLGREALKVAIAELKKGAGETAEDFPGPFVAKYHRVTTERAAKLDHSWSASFVSFCFRKAAAQQNRIMPFKYTLGAQNILNQARANDKYVFRPSDEQNLPEGLDIPQPGDVVIWKRGSKAWQGHAGIVHSLAHGILYVIEGNRGPFPSKVAVFDYTTSRMENILSVIRYEP